MNITVILMQLLQLFMMIGLGLLIGKCALCHDSLADDLTKLVLNITMPFLILSSVTSSLSGQIPVTDIFIATFILVILLPIVSYFIVKVFIKNQDASLYMFMMIYPNVGFMGFPLIQSIYGQGALLYTAIINIGFNISLFSLGVFMMDQQRHLQPQIFFKKLISPGIIASFIALGIYLFHIELPDFIISFCSSIGNMTTPLSMMIIGLTMSQYNLKNMLSHFYVYLFCIFINLVLPICFMPFFQWIHHDVVRGIALIILAMPVANSAALYAKTYHHNEQLAVQSIFISTLLSMLTIPLLVYLFLI